jgi:hypothetical protein
MGHRLDQLTATHVYANRSAVRHLSADQARLERAAVNRLRSGHATIERSAVAVAQFDEGTLRQSSAAIVVANSLACDEVHTVVLASGVVRGTVHTWLDLRAAFALGLGLVVGKVIFDTAQSLLQRSR